MFGSFLVIVTKLSVFKAQYISNTQTLSYETLFSIKDSNKHIKQAIFSEKHKNVYLIVRKSFENSSTICKLDLSVVKNCLLKNEINLKVNQFEVSKVDPLNMFLICKRSVFRFRFQINSEEMDQNVMNQSNTPQTKQIELKKIYSNYSNLIKFFKFDDKMKYYYTHDKNIIKKCIFKTGEVVYTLSDDRALVKNIWFGKNFKLMIR